MVANAVGDEALVKAEAAKRWPKASLYEGFVTDHDRYRGQWGVQSPATRRLQLVATKDRTSELMTAASGRLAVTGRADLLLIGA